MAQSEYVAVLREAVCCIGDFSAWETPAAYQAAFERLLRDLKAESGERDSLREPESS